MSDCCSALECELKKLQNRQKNTLILVLVINAAMFGVELFAGLLSGSVALLADSLDMLGDALVYSFSLFVIARSSTWKAGSAVLKGGIMMVFGLFVLSQTAYKIVAPQIPSYEIMSMIGLLALLANAVCLSVLWRHKGEDINMRSVWLCSRNDIIANASVLAAAVGVWIFQTRWPDIIVGLGIALLFIRSAYQVLKEANHTLSVSRIPAPAE